MLYIASDHAGHQTKKSLFTFINTQLGLEITDLGPEKFDQDDDYVDYAAELAKNVAKDPDNRGILICATGHGMCITANKINGIRAITGYNIQSTELGRKHNNANVLCLAGKILSEDHAQAIAKVFLNTEFEKEERHVRRIGKIAKIEQTR